MRFSKLSLDEMLVHFERENASLKKEQERLKGVIKDLMDKNCELIKKIEFLRHENKSLRYEAHLISIISSLGTLGSKV